MNVIVREYDRLRRLAFTERFRANQRRFDQSEKGKAAKRVYEKSAAYRCSERRKAKVRRYWLSDKGKAAARRYGQSEHGRANRLHNMALRRARKRGALVVGAAAAIAAIYEKMRWLRSQGWDVAVDHIFPLGFGWHEPGNLQIIFASENNAKGSQIDFAPSVTF